MFRVFHVLLMIAAIVACPLSCLAQSSAGAGPEQAAKSCSCCQRTYGTRGTGQDGSGPGPNRQEQQENASCVCHGALYESPRRPAALDVDLSLFVIAEPSLAFGDSLAVSELRHATDKPAFSNPVSGRETRVLMNSWLL